MPFCSPPVAAGLLGFDFHWRECPCFGETVTGDGLFLEVGRKDGQSLLLLVDVMGHGPAAAAVVAELRDLILPRPACADLSPGQLLTVLDRLLAPTWDARARFVAAQAFLVGPTGDLIGSAAGIPAPLHRSAGPTVTPWNLSGGTVLGPMFGSAYSEGALSLQPGDGLLACTDGVSEAGIPHFGNALLAAFLLADPSGVGLVDRLFAALQKHVGLQWPDDDTMAFWLERPAVVSPPAP
jgi:serine phosphatase RsbU (regulator of sigma subunit)